MAHIACPVARALYYSTMSYSTTNDSTATLPDCAVQAFHPNGKPIVGAATIKVGGDYLIPTTTSRGKKVRTALVPFMCGITSYPPAEPEPAWDYWLEVDNSVRKSKWRKVYFDEE